MPIKPENLYPEGEPVTPTAPCYRCAGTGKIALPGLARVVSALSRTEWRSAAEVASALDLEQSHVATVLRRLHRAGSPTVERVGAGVKGAPHRWRRRG